MNKIVINSVFMKVTQFWIKITKKSITGKIFLENQSDGGRG